MQGNHFTHETPYFARGTGVQLIAECHKRIPLRLIDANNELAALLLVFAL